MVDKTPGSFNLPDGYTLRHLDTVDSTSLEAKRQAHEGASAGLWVLADQQTKGKGRLGRDWASLPGNLFASLLLYPACDLKHIPELSFVSAVAVAATIRNFTAAEVTCKWPNDVLIDGKKAAGILLEAETSANPQKPWVVIGIGINVVAAPEDADYPAASLEGAADRDQVFEVLADYMANIITRWGQDGFGPVRTLWLNQAHGRGQTLEIDTGGKTIKGTFSGLSNTGALLLEDFQGTVHEIISGTVLKD